MTTTSDAHADRETEEYCITEHGRFGRDVHILAHGVDGMRFQLDNIRSASPHFKGVRFSVYNEGTGACILSRVMAHQCIIERSTRVAGEGEDNGTQ